MQAIVDFMAAHSESTPVSNEAARAEPSKPGRPVSDFRKYKTTLCRSYLTGLECPYRENCIFAHGEAELRSETDNQTLKLANELIGAEEQTARRRTRSPGGPAG